MNQVQKNYDKHVQIINTRNMLLYLEKKITSAENTEQNTEQNINYLIKRLKVLYFKLQKKLQMMESRTFYDV